MPNNLALFDPVRIIAAVTRSWAVPPLAAALLVVLFVPTAAPATMRGLRAVPRGPWRGALGRELPRLYREFNAIDFGHAHLAETLLHAPDDSTMERARRDVLRVIARRPSVPLEEALVAPSFARLVWPLERTLDWTHAFHRSLYDLLASDSVTDKHAAYRKLLARYLSSPDAITHRALDHHGRLWSFPESRAFRDSFPRFNSQVWTYHWLQAAAYDVQLSGPARRQRELMPAILRQYHDYLDRPAGWRFMPLMAEVAPRFTLEYPEAAAIFDNLHMLHDNVDDILTRRDLFPTRGKQRDAILKVLRIYLARGHRRGNALAEYETAPDEHAIESQGGHTTEIHGERYMHGSGGVQGGVEHPAGERPPSADEVIRRRTNP